MFVSICWALWYNGDPPPPPHPISWDPQTMNGRDNRFSRLRPHMGPSAVHRKHVALSDPYTSMPSSSDCLSFPSVRGGSLGLVLAAGCVGMAASSLMELQNNSGYFLHHVIFASFAVLSVLSIMLLPESKRKPLPDSLKDGREPSATSALSVPARPGQPAPAVHPPASVVLQPRKLFPLGFSHQEDVD